MESPKKDSDSSNVFSLETLRRTFEENARADGFGSHAEQMAHEHEQEEARKRSAELAERLVKGPARRAKLCKTLEGRMSDKLLAEIEADTSKLWPTKAWRAVQSWLVSPFPALVLCGGTGSGKTIAAIRAMLEDTHRAQFVRALHLGPHFQPWSWEADLRLAPLDVTCGFLVVDDLGDESVTDGRSMRALQEIGDARQSIRRRTAYTSNFTAEKFRAHYQEHAPRFLSRLKATARIATIDDIDHRGAR